MIRLDNLFGIGGIVWEVGRHATCGVALSVDLQLSSGVERKSVECRVGPHRLGGMDGPSPTPCQLHPLTNTLLDVRLPSAPFTPGGLGCSAAYSGTVGGFPLGNKTEYREPARTHRRLGGPGRAIASCGHGAVGSEEFPTSKRRIDRLE